MSFNRCGMSGQWLWQRASLLFILLAASACTRPAAGPADLTVPSGAVTTLSGNPAQHQIGATQTASARQLVLPTETVTLYPITETLSAAPTSAATAAEPAEISSAEYLLSAGETPECIARRFNLDIGELLSLNELLVESLPPAGTVLRLPQTGHLWSSGERAAQPHPASYQVQAGDTIGMIACRYGDLSPQQILSANQLDANTPLTAGQILMIP
jgi:LysM repeat protein